MTAATRLGWAPGSGFAPASTAPERAPLVVDSWLLADGEASDRPAHDERFAEGCAALIPDLGAESARRFLADVDQALPGVGAGSRASSRTGRGRR